MHDTDPAEGLAVLHVVVRASETNSQYNEHCLPVMHLRRITVCSLFPADVTPPQEIRMIEGDGSVRGCFRALRQALAAGAYDIVHVHAAASGILTAFVYLRSRRSRQDLVFTMHNSWPSNRLRNRLFLLLVAAYFPVLVMCGESAAASLPRPMRLLAKRIEVVPNGVDVERIDRVLSVAPSPEPNQGLQVASVGRLIPLKDPATVMEAFVRAANADDVLLLVGGGSLSGEVSTAIQQTGLEGQIQLTGLVSREDVYRTLDRAAVFVSASTSEGLPVAVLEAMACRCAVVLSDIPPHRDIARYAPAVRLVPVRDVARFQEALAALLRMTPSRRTVIAEELRRCAVEHFSVEAMNAGYGRVYYTVTQRNGDSGALVAPQQDIVRRPLTRWVVAGGLGLVAALGYSATHPASYAATTTLAVGDVDALQTDAGLGLGASDAATVADLVRRQVVLEPVAQSLSLDDWRRLQRQVRSRVGASPLFVDVTATAATSASAERLAEAVAERVVQLHAVESGPEPDLAFADRELDRLGAEIARTQAGIDRLLQQMDTAGPAAAGPLGRQLSVLRRKLAMLEATSSGMRGWRSEAGRTPGVRIENEAYAERGSWPPQPALIALLGAAGGLCALAALGLLTRLRRSERLADGGFAKEEEHAVPAARPVRVAAPVTRVGSRRWPSKS